MYRKFKIDDLVRSRVAKMKPYSSARNEFSGKGPNYIFLDANENPIENGLNRYPDPQQENLKTALSAEKNLTPDKITLGNGSDELLDLLFRAFCDPGRDNIITLPPTYGMYKVLAELNAVENREVPLNIEFQPNSTDILKQVNPQTKLLFLCSPNNPTGNSFSAPIVQELLESFPGLVVIDEAYIDFSPHESWITRLNEFPNLVVTQTFSKAFGLAGIRLGACYASPAITDILGKIKPPYNVNELTQEQAALRLGFRNVVEQEIQDILRQKNLLAYNLQKLNLVRKIFPSDANFWLVRVDDGPKRYRQLLEKNIIIRNRSKQPLCENTLRITVGTEKENQKIIEVLKELDT